ncbi:MAG: hypothetical protein Q9191_008176 [Dirinaria sp. TL-2023a]
MTLPAGCRYKVSRLAQQLAFACLVSSLPPMSKIMAMRSRHADSASSQFLPYFFFPVALLLSLQPAVCQVSFPLTAFPAWSTVAPCMTGALSEIWNTDLYDDCASDVPIKSYGSCVCAYQMTMVNENLRLTYDFDAECSTSGVSDLVTQLCSWSGVDLAKAAAGAGSAGVTLTASATGAGATGVATPGDTARLSHPTSTSGAPATSSTAAGNGKHFGGLTMDEVIALAVGIPSVILAAVAVWYARQNNVFQRMSMYFQRHTNPSGHHSGYQDWGSGTNLGGHNFGSPEWGSGRGYNGWQQQTGSGSNLRLSGNRAPYY